MNAISVFTRILRVLIVYLSFSGAQIWAAETISGIQFYGNWCLVETIFVAGSNELETPPQEFTFYEPKYVGSNPPEDLLQKLLKYSWDDHRANFDQHIYTAEKFITKMNDGQLYGDWVIKGNALIGSLSMVVDLFCENKCAMQIYSSWLKERAYTNIPVDDLFTIDDQDVMTFKRQFKNETTEELIKESSGMYNRCQFKGV